jgi:hypothetical protein
MSQKFSLAIKMKNGKIIDSILKQRVDAQIVIDQFKAWREEGVEAYLFTAPVADKRSKSTEQIEASSGVKPEPEVKEVAKPKAKSSKNEDGLVDL